MNTFLYFEANDAFYLILLKYIKKLSNDNFKSLFLYLIHKF
jgi:hypothetical protein